MLTPMDIQTFGRVPGYLQRLRREKEDEQLRWEEEKRREQERLDNMRLSDTDRDSILKVLYESFRKESTRITKPLALGSAYQLVRGSLSVPEAESFDRHAAQKDPKGAD